MKNIFSAYYYTRKSPGESSMKENTLSPLRGYSKLIRKLIAHCMQKLAGPGIETARRLISGQRAAQFLTFCFLF